MFSHPRLGSGSTEPVSPVSGPRTPGAPKSPELRDLYWRSEILRVMYWLRGEGLGDVVDIPTIERFLGIGARVSRRHLATLVTEGCVNQDGSWYTLSEAGLAAGEEEFATAFSDILRPAHGECSPECWCDMSPSEADACATARSSRDRKATT